MTPLEREEMKRRAQAKLAAMRERARRLRRRVLTAAAIGFAVLWAAVFAQMMTGHDPALGPATANVRGAAQESVAADPERRALRAFAPPGDDEDDGQLEAARLEAEQAEAEQIEAAAVEAEQAEAEELEPVTTGQS